MMTFDLVQNFSKPLASPIIAGFNVVPDDDNFVHPDTLVTLYVGGYGNLVYEDATGHEVTLRNFSGKLELGGVPIAVSKLKTSTTCTLITAFVL